ncbi:MAG: hypothetical protein AB7D24_11890 [Sphaerochaeta sp.]|uniref:hypothetical protein n=1 Tax=Sphaerochaeta sp. TaxID=1972642 RepID=UPI003D140DF4
MAIHSMNYKNGSENGFMETTHDGLVISTGEHNWYDDSDFFAIVWNPEKQVEEEITYATTRFPTYGNYAEVDFDKEKYGADYERFNRICSFVSYMESTYSLFGNKSDKGKLVEVVKGRKVPIGTIGTIFSVKRNDYSEYNACVMIKTEDGKYLNTYLFNLKPVHPTYEQKSEAWLRLVGPLDDTFKSFL